ncbi:Uncharacterised protein [Mycobacteroides abscessus subsp. abscessus]|nr:Uncharacterised protein [Mycobacteroides abscessus subsp. abscessus]
MRRRGRNWTDARRRRSESGPRSWRCPQDPPPSPRPPHGRTRTATPTYVPGVPGQGTGSWICSARQARRSDLAAAHRRVPRGAAAACHRAVHDRTPTASPARTSGDPRSSALPYGESIAGRAGLQWKSGIARTPAPREPRRSLPPPQGRRRRQRRRWYPPRQRPHRV